MTDSASSSATASGHYYRFSMDRQKSYRRLIRRRGGQGGCGGSLGRREAYEGSLVDVRLECRRRLIGYLEGARSDLVIPADCSGTIGYSWYNEDRFRGIRIRRSPDSYVMAGSAPKTPCGLRSRSPMKARAPDHRWHIRAGRLEQVSNIHTPDDDVPAAVPTRSWVIPCGRTTVRSS
jgi:hypothetical protein